MLYIRFFGFILSIFFFNSTCPKMSDSSERPRCPCAIRLSSRLMAQRNGRFSATNDDGRERAWKVCGFLLLCCEDSMLQQCWFLWQRSFCDLASGIVPVMLYDCSKGQSPSTYGLTCWKNWQHLTYRVNFPHQQGITYLHVCPQNPNQKVWGKAKPGQCLGYSLFNMSFECFIDP